MNKDKQEIAECFCSCPDFQFLISPILIIAAGPKFCSC
ncbi:MAG: hypothetical protein JXB19_06540 [Bacteroidales bacterium]|nr:hypothetical protein [Bacteroidales bacterium]